MNVVSAAVLGTTRAGRPLVERKKGSLITVLCLSGFPATREIIGEFGEGEEGRFVALRIEGQCSIAFGDLYGVLLENIAAVHQIGHHVPRHSMDFLSIHESPGGHIAAAILRQERVVVIDGVLGRQPQHLLREYAAVI